MSSLRDSSRSSSSSSSRTTATATAIEEQLNLDEEEQKAYAATALLLQQSPSSFLGPFPTVVSLRDLVEDPLPEPPQQQQHHDAAQELPISLRSPNKGHHALFRALEELEGLEKEEAALVEHSPLTAPLTEIIVTKQYYRHTTFYSSSPKEALDHLQKFSSIPRRVCQHPFRKNDIVWVCRTCQADETCVLCHACFSQSNHEGHDVAFYHAQAGGCCDCGDPDAWDPAGFCPHHGPKTHSYYYSKSSDTAADTATATEDHPFPLTADQVRRVRGVVPSAVDWMVQEIAKNANAGYRRAQGCTSNSTSSDEATLYNSNNNNNNTASLDEDNDDDHDDYMDTESATEYTPRDVAVNGNAVNAARRNNSHDDNSMEESDSQENEVSSPSASFRTMGPLHNQHQHQNQSQDDDHLQVHRRHPTSLAQSPASQRHDLEAAFLEDLGRIGREGRGLYLVLFADDIHSLSQWIEVLHDLLGASSYYTDSLLAKFVQALRQYGYLVVWGTMELSHECGATNVHLWQDGDAVASSKIAESILTKAQTLRAKGFFCSIATLRELQLEQRAVAMLQWLSALACSCDPLCQTVAECILPNRHLAPLLKEDFTMSPRITKAWYSLLLTLLAVPAFKSHLAAAYCDTYQVVTAKYAAGMGFLERSAYTLSVQFLNRVTYVVDLVQHHDLMGKLGKSLFETLRVAKGPDFGRRLNPNHFVMSHRRYSPCISDLKCVLNVRGMKRLFACHKGTFLKDWISALSLAQFMDPQAWRHWIEGHAEDESRGWVGAFNLSISLGSLFERLLSWEDYETSPIKDPLSPFSGNLLPCMQLTYHIMINGVLKWQQMETACYKPTVYTSAVDQHKSCPASLPFSTIASNHGCALAFQQLPIAQVTSFSFHLPLHRFLAACLRETCRRQHSGVEDLLETISTKMSENEKDLFFRGLMEFPAMVLTRASQVRAGIWRRNGPGLNDQVLNYAEPPFCRSMRDADLLLLQFAMLNRRQRQSPSQRPASDVGISFLVHLLLHRLGIFDVAGLVKAPNTNIHRYLDEVSKQLYPDELRPNATDSDVVLPWTYSPARDASTWLILLEEFLLLMIMLIVELPPLPPTDKADHTQQAKERLRREVIHRLASGPKTHSELSEVHLILSHWDNTLLSEEGKSVNPDDATGAALGAVLEEVADRKSSCGKLEPDKWELQLSAWKEYDPSFCHISLRCHQTAAEGRPKCANDNNGQFSVKPYAPTYVPAHPSFERLRQDVTSDATVLAIAYRILHLHCMPETEKVDESKLGNLLLENNERSETALARAVHILTLGAFAWENASSSCARWRELGGGSPGSIFYHWQTAPTVRDWILAALLPDPGELLDCEGYQGEENTLKLLQRLAVDGGNAGSFVAQDLSVRSGAAWLCDFALKHCSFATTHIHANSKGPQGTGSLKSGSESKSELERKKHLAKQKALARMKDQAAKFASTMKEELNVGEDDEDSNLSNFSGAASNETMSLWESNKANHYPPNRSPSLGSQQSLSSASMDTTGADRDRSFSQVKNSLTGEVSFGSLEDSTIPSRLLKVRPQCIICNDASPNSQTRPSCEDAGHRQNRRRKKDGGKALGFVAYVQASTVLRGGGGVLGYDQDSSLSPARRFVGAHVALCGHAVHSECCEAYLATVSHREDRISGKRDEFRCPLCQRLSNCLVPFIDVGEGWICAPTTMNSRQNGCLAPPKLKSDMDVAMADSDAAFSFPNSLRNFLDSTPWWLSRHNPDVGWDGQSAFVSKTTSSSHDKMMERVTPQFEQETSPSRSKPRRRSVRSLRKRDLYAAWNTMMQTPQYVRHRFRRLGENEALPASRSQEATMSYNSDFDGPTGETVVWRRLMDQICDVAYRADSKRLGEGILHDDFGEFRHYVTEKFAYNLAKRVAGIDPTDWPLCIFSTSLSDTKKQELSREKLLSKLLMTIQSFTYSCCCEAFDARQALQQNSLSLRHENLQKVYSKFGIHGALFNGRVLLLPVPSSTIDDGSQPFNGRIGRLRYFALAVMAAAGAVSADLVQLAMAFPHEVPSHNSKDSVSEKPDRAPIAYPILLGNVLTHVVAAMCASCGWARAQSDSLELDWLVPFSIEGRSFFSENGKIDPKHDHSVVEDCEGFMKLGLLARILQVLLAALDLVPNEMESFLSKLVALRKLCSNFPTNMPDHQKAWIRTCLSLLEVALGDRRLPESTDEALSCKDQLIDQLSDACVTAASAACSFLVDISTIFQVLVPGVMVRYNCSSNGTAPLEQESDSSLAMFEELSGLFGIEPVLDMLQSSLVRNIIIEWFNTAHEHTLAYVRRPDIPVGDSSSALQSRLLRTQGFRLYDWPMQSLFDWKCFSQTKTSTNTVKWNKKRAAVEPQDESNVNVMQTEFIQYPTRCQTPAAGMQRWQTSASLVTFSSKKTVPLFGGHRCDLFSKANDRPRIAVIPTSYTDLYAELGALLPECEQIAVCFVCGDVLNAGGKGECTRHSYKCGAGAGLFFLLQECSGLIMHMGKAAYIHSPYVDSHGETPQYRGRPLNLDFTRYEHLREVWLGHKVRQQVLAERGSARQVIVPDFY